MLPSALNDDGSNSLTSTPTVTMEVDQVCPASSNDVQKDMQQRPNSKSSFFSFPSSI